MFFFSLFEWNFLRISTIHLLFLVFQILGYLLLTCFQRINLIRTSRQRFKELWTTVSPIILSLSESKLVLRNLILEILQYFRVLPIHSLVVLFFLFCHHCFSKSSHFRHFEITNLFRLIYEFYLYIISIRGLQFFFKILDAFLIGLVIVTF